MFDVLAFYIFKSGNNSIPFINMGVKIDTPSQKLTAFLSKFIFGGLKDYTVQNVSERTENQTTNEKENHHISPKKINSARRIAPQSENLMLRFMRGLITIQMERLSPLSFCTTILFMVFVIIMMKCCSTIIITFLQAFGKNLQNILSR
jgi:hypothetical protein